MGGINISTRSRIGILKKDGSIESVYCHYDGYLDGVGRTLHNYYSNYEDIKELLQLGDISSLKEKVKSDGTSKDDVTIAYHRDYGEQNKELKSKINKDLNEFNEMLFDAWIGYIYLYDEKNNKWLWDNYSAESTELDLKPLENYFMPEISINSISCSEVKELLNNNYEYLVLQGCGGNLKDWVDGITDMLRANKIVPDSFSFNEIYSFEDNNLVNMAFALNSKNIDMGKLAIFRLKIREEVGAMWLSDYIDNGYIKDVNI